MRLLARAGTDPGGMVALLERLSKHEVRLKNVRATIAALVFVACNWAVRIDVN